MAGIYIHIPFCKSRCAYCDFYSTTRIQDIEAYVVALEREMKARQTELGDARVRSIYIGGGTPSVLTTTQLQRILNKAHDYFTVDEDAEVTMEMNPDDVMIDDLELMIDEYKRKDSHLQPSIINHQSSINRISLGIQTFDDGLLRLIRRRHDAAQAVEAVRRLQEAGIGNISIDLIYGLPGQTIDMWERDLDKAFSLGVQHLSAYALSYETGTDLTRWRAEGRVQEVPEEVQVKMYERLCQRAGEAGFEHYEISNFALHGFHSRHNSSYWTGEAYLGFGPGAHSYDGVRTRRANKPDLTAYLGGVERSEVEGQGSEVKVESSKLKVERSEVEGRGSKGEGQGSEVKVESSKLKVERSEGEGRGSKVEGQGSEMKVQSSKLKVERAKGEGKDEQWFTTEVLTDEELYDEAVMCGLRTARGVLLEDIERRFGQQKLEYLMKQAAPHLRTGRLAQTDGRLHLTARSLMVSDDVMSDLMA